MTPSLYAPVPGGEYGVRIYERAEGEEGRTAGRGAHVFGGTVERDGLEAVRVVRSDGAEDDEEQSFVRRADADGFLRADWVGLGGVGGKGKGCVLSEGRMYRLCPVSVGIQCWSSRTRSLMSSRSASPSNVYGAWSTELL